MVHSSLDFMHVKTFSLYKTTFFNPSSNDVHVFNSLNVSHNFTLIVYSWNYDL